MPVAPCVATFRARLWLRVALLAALLLPGTILSVRAAEPTTAQTPVPRALPATLVGRTNLAQAITIAATLKPADQKALDGFLAELYDPASPIYHHYLTPQSFTQRFFDPTARKQVAGYLQSLGLAVSDPGVGEVIDAMGTVAQVERAFKVTLTDYRDARGRVFYQTDVTPTIPVSIANVTYGITGLDDAPLATDAGQAASTPAPAPGPARDAPTRQAVCAGAQGEASSTVYLPSQFATAYHLSDLYTQGYHGENQKVALFEMADYHDAAPQTYQACFNTSVPLTRVLVDGGPTGASQYSGEVEDDIDIEALIGLAPNLAGILVYESPNSVQGGLHQYQKIANDDLAPVVSTSWNYCEPVLAGLNITRPVYHVTFEQMAAQGQTVFAAAGDYGPTECLNLQPPYTDQIAVTYPASDQYITGVGGTHLTIDSNTSAWTSETAWNSYPTETFAGGGGVSVYWSRFPWQRGPGADNNPLNPDNNRMVPDVSIAGDRQYIDYAQGAWHTGNGTSLGAPHWAAGTTLINQYLLAHAKTRLGYANPALYEVFNSALYSSAFHDITTDNNCIDPASTCIVAPNTAVNTAGDLYTAGTDYDMASGIGSPQFGPLAAALADVPLSPTIASIFPNSGGTAGGNTVTITGTNFAAPMGVYFGANFTPATNVVVVNSTTITATTPAANAAFAADVTLTTAAAGPAYVQVTLPGGYTYVTPNTLPG